MGMSNPKYEGNRLTDGFGPFQFDPRSPLEHPKNGLGVGGGGASRDLGSVGRFLGDLIAMR